MKLKNGSGNDTSVFTNPPIPAEAAKKMLLSAIGRSKSNHAERIILFAPEGWGKTTWASKTEKPIFISTEDGMKAVKVDVFPEPGKWKDLFEAIDTLRVEKHGYKTLVIDTADWSEHLCQKFLCERDKKDSIEEYGYGKGYVLAFEEWKRILSPLDALRHEKGMNIIFLAHSQIRTFNNPSGENFDRWEMKLDRRISALLKEWADCVLFGNYDIAVDVKKGASKGKGFGGNRVIYTNHSPAWDAKNRHGLPEQLDSNPESFWKIVSEVK